MKYGQEFDAIFVSFSCAHVLCVYVIACMLLSFSAKRKKKRKKRKEKRKSNIKRKKKRKERKKEREILKDISHYVR